MPTWYQMDEVVDTFAVGLSDDIAGVAVSGSRQRQERRDDRRDDRGSEQSSANAEQAYINCMSARGYSVSP